MRHVTAVLTVAVCTMLGTLTAPAAEYQIDPAHSSLSFRVGHLDIAKVHGLFGTFEGNFHFDADDIAASSVRVTIQAESVNTNQERRDDHLRHDDYLKVEDFPTMTYVSREITEIDGKTFKIVGDLTLLEATREVVLDVTYNGSVTDHRDNERVGFSATTSLDRHDFGVIPPQGDDMVGREIAIVIDIEGIKQQAEEAE